MKLEEGADQAIASLLQAVKLAPGLLQAHLRLGGIYLQRKQEYELAVKHLEKAVEGGADRTAARQLLIQAYRRLGMDEKAEEQLRLIKKSTP